MQAPRLSLLGSWGHGRGEAGRVGREEERTPAQCAQCWVFLKEKKTLCTKKPHSEFPNIASQGSRLLKLCHEHADFLGLRVPFTTGSLVPRVAG